MKNEEQNTKMDMMIFNWHSEDRADDPDDDSEWPEKFYHIYLFGINEKGESICLDVENYTPFFYVKVPEFWDHSEASRLVGAIKRKLWKRGKHLTSHKLMYKKDAYGFNNQKEFRFLRLVFNNSRVMNSVKWMFKKPIEGFEQQKFPIYNGNIDPLLVFMHIRNIQACGWVSVDDDELTENDISRCKYNYSVHWKKIEPLDRNDIPPLKTLSFDLECYSPSGAFPNPTHSGDAIIQIGSSFQRFGEMKTNKVVIVLGECSDVKDVKIISCKTEEDVIKEWVKLVKRQDPDQFIGYNIDDFDWSYLWKRACLLGCESYLEDLSRLYHVKSDYKADKMESKAYGANIFNIITTPGIGQIDLLHWFRKETKLDSYKLDSVAQKFLGDKKNDVTPRQIFEWGGPDGDSKSRATVAAYCAQDTALPLRLMEDRCMLPNLIEMSKVTCVPLTWLVTRGQQIKVYSQIQKELRSGGFLLPEMSKKFDNEGYTGATVLSCQRGYYNEPVSGLDFKSLYPSIMIAHNLCITTWVRLPKYENVEDTTYKHVQWENGDYKFAQNKKGVIPGILERLWGERNKTKKEMKNEKDPRMKAILNGKQLAIKVSMNSIYGVMGATVGYINCKPIASTVTYIGRTMIEHSQKCAEEWYNGSEESNGIVCRVIYGDSYEKNTPVTVIDNNGRIKVLKTEDLALKWESYSQFKSEDSNRKEKQQSNVPEGTMVWSKTGWSQIKRVIRHKVNKRMFRVVTKKGIVVVTEDHSLLRPCGKHVKPKEVKIGEELMHKYIEIPNV